MTRWNTRLAIGAALVLGAACGRAPVAPLADSPEWAEARKKAAFLDSGANLGRARAEDVVRHLDEAPDDVLSRNKLLLFLSANGTRFYDPEVVVASRRKHILWLIEHHPEDPLLADPAGALTAAGDPAGFSQAKKLWQAKPPELAPNAAAWMKIADPPPLDPISIPAHEAAAAQHHADLAAKAEGVGQSLGSLGVATEKACEESDWDKAAKSSADVLRVAPSSRNDPDYGSAIFQAHIVAGILAMRAGDRKVALAHLAQAADAPATEDLQYRPQPDAYRLLSWLLKDGERDTVIQFLEKFSKTSVVDRDQLRQSVELIRKNQKPVWYPE